MIHFAVGSTARRMPRSTLYRVYIQLHSRLGQRRQIYAKNQTSLWHYGELELAKQ